MADPNRVASHSFYPLISYTISSKKIKKDPSTGILSPSIKNRPIAYAAHSDSHIYSYYARILADRYERELAVLSISSCVLAFRSLDKSNIEFAKQVFDEISSRDSCVAIALDISSFFDSLDHGILKKAWTRIVHCQSLPQDHYAIYRSLTKWAAVDKTALFCELGISIHTPKKDGRHRLCDVRTFREIVRGGRLITTNKSKKGIPQGTPISALLSNIYMLEFDVLISNVVSAIGGRYYRYCDDIIVIVPLNHEEHALTTIKGQIDTVALKINDSKTCISRFHSSSSGRTCDKPLQYLGFLYDGEKTLIRSAALARYSQKMKHGVWLAKATMRKSNHDRLIQGLPTRGVFRKQIYSRYSHLGTRNFLRYGYRAARILDSRAIRRQLKPLWNRLLKEIEK